MRPRDEQTSSHPARLDRRAFLAGAGALVAAGAAGALPALQAPVPAAATVPAAPASAAAFHPFQGATIAELQALMTTGRATARQIAAVFLDIIQRDNPRFRAVLEVNPEALDLAAALDAERGEKGPRGPLHGIPVLLKDNVDTADRMTTTAGSLALEGSLAARDAAVAARLRQAGAVLLAKTNMSEWANFRSTRSSSGWSGRGGQCCNAYAESRSPSGSSSGSGVAIARGYAPVAVGTETDGSIVSPSSANCLVGIKPTVGLVSRAGIIPIAHSQDTAGPMARTVADAAALLSVLAGEDPRDEATRAGRDKARGKTADYARFLDPAGLKGARIGVARKPFFGRHPGVDKAMEEALAALRAGGAELIDPVEIPHVGEYDDSEFEVLLYEFKADLNRYLASLGPQLPVHTLAEVIAWNERHRDRAMPYFGQEIMEQAEAKGPLTEEAYRKALEKNRKLARTEGLDAAFAKHKLDAIVAPTGGPAWLIDLVNGDAYSGGSSSPAAVAGTPSITVPAGWVSGLPVGISFMGAAWSEGTLIRLAYAYEQATKVHRRPGEQPKPEFPLWPSCPG
jgi:amidase